MKFFTDEAFRNKIFALLGVLVLFLSQSYVKEVLDSKNAFKSSLYSNFKSYVEEIEGLDTYLSGLREIKSIDEIKPVYLEEPVILLFEDNSSKAREIKRAAFGSNFYPAVDSYLDINKNLALIIQDNIISETEKIYLDEIYEFNHANLEYAAELIKYYSADDQDIKALEKNIFDTYIDNAIFLGETYKVIYFKEEASSTIEIDAYREKVREKLEIVSKGLTGNRALSYYKEPNADESEVWTYVTRDNPGDFERTDESIYNFDYVPDENKVSFYKSAVINDQEPMQILKEDQMKALANEHVKKLAIESEFLKADEHKDSNYTDFYYQKKYDGLYYEANNIKVTVNNEGSIYSEFYLTEDEPEINWADEKIITEKFNDGSDIKSIIKIINAKNQGEYLVMNEYNKGKYISVYDGETLKLKIYDRLDKDKHSFYYNILMN